MSRETELKYLRIGGFVLTGLILIFLTIVIFGSGLLFKQHIYVETYFSESVQGLTDGSPVKYLGMDIGHVKEIEAVDSVYNLDRNFSDRKQHRYIYVLMSINPKFFIGKSFGAIRREIESDVASGLRVKLALQGLTGNAYLELDFLDPKTNTELPIYWTPKNNYIPSTTSTLAYFSDNVQAILRQLRNVKWKKLVANIQDMIKSADKVSYKLDRILAQTDQQMVSTAENAQNISNNLNDITERAKGFSSSLLFGKPPPKLDPGKL